MDGSVTQEKLNKYGDDLNLCIKQNNFVQLKTLLGDSNNMYLNGQSGSKKIYINVKVIRKDPLRFCAGDHCFKKDPNCNRQDLFNISCCRFHLYCKNCLKNYIIMKLQTTKNNKVEIGCEACEEMFIENKKLMSYKEILCFVTSEEYEVNLKLGLKSKYFSICQLRHEDCKYKEKPIFNGELVKFDCCGTICLQCFGLFTEIYLAEIFTKLQNSPQELEDQVIGVICPCKNNQSIRILTLAEIYKCIDNSISPPQNKENIKFLLKKYAHLLGNGVLKCCKSCGNLECFKGILKCQNCNNCIECSNVFHGEYTCENFRELCSKEAILDIDNNLQQVSKNEHEPSFPLISRATELLRKNGIGNYKIINFVVPESSGLQDFHFSRLRKTYETKNSYVFSPPLDNHDQVYDFFYEGIKPGDTGLVELPSKPKNLNENCWFIIYQVLISREIISRKHNANDLSDEPLVYSNNDKLYFANKDAIIPYLVIFVEQLLA